MIDAPACDVCGCILVRPLGSDKTVASFCLNCQATCEVCAAPVREGLRFCAGLSACWKIGTADSASRLQRRGVAEGLHVAARLVDRFRDGASPAEVRNLVDELRAMAHEETWRTR